MGGIKLWWGGQSKTTKGLYIFGAIATLGIITYFATRDSSEKQDLKTKENSNSDIPNTNESNSEQQLLKEDESQIIDKDSLPNKGVNCGDVKTTYDKDFDYVKCDSIWYAKSKPNAVSVTAKGLYKDWNSLANNAIATDRLNRRYPRG